MPHGTRISCQLGRELPSEEYKGQKGTTFCQRRQEDFIIAHPQAFKGHTQTPNNMRLA